MGGAVEHQVHLVAVPPTRAEQSGLKRRRAGARDEPGVVHPVVAGDLAVVVARERDSGRALERSCDLGVVVGSDVHLSRQQIDRLTVTPPALVALGWAAFICLPVPIVVDAVSAILWHTAGILFVLEAVPVVVEAVAAGFWAAIIHNTVAVIVERIGAVLLSWRIFALHDSVLAPPSGVATTLCTYIRKWNILVLNFSTAEYLTFVRAASLNWTRCPKIMHECTVR